MSVVGALAICLLWALLTTGAAYDAGFVGPVLAAPLSIVLAEVLVRTMDEKDGG